jgi:transposase
MDTHESADGARLSVGIAGSTAALDVALRPEGEPWRGANDEAGSAERVTRRQPLAPHVLVLEATGGWERLVVAAVTLAGLPVAVVHPRHGRDCATATGRWAKTAALDAAVLAHFAEAMRPQPRPLPDAQSQALAAVVERRRQVVGMLTAEQHRVPQALPPVRPQVAAHSAWLEQALAERETELDQRLRASPVWRERAHWLRSVPGVGPAVSRTLLAHLPARGHGAVKHVAMVVGRAPLTRDRGAWRGTRAIWGGRRQGRAALSMAAVVAVRHHPVRRAFDARLLARGKPKTVALTACRHKLLLILHAVLRDRTPWQPTQLAT